MRLLSMRFLAQCFSLLFFTTMIASYSQQAWSTTECSLEKEDGREDEGFVLHLGKMASFIAARGPNRNELFTDVILVAPIDFFLSNFINLGPNPAAKAFQKDLAKLFSTIWRTRCKMPMGGTAFNYDKSSLYRQVSKTGTKVFVIFFLVGTGLTSPSAAGLLANIPGDLVARVFEKAGMAYQLEQLALQERAQQRDKDMCLALVQPATRSFEDYLVDQSSRIGRLFVDSVQEVLPKLAIVTGISAVMTLMGTEDKIFSAVFAVPRIVFGAQMDPKISFISNTRALMRPEGGFRFRNAFLLSTTASVTASFLKIFTTTVVLSTVSWVVMDAISLIQGSAPVPPSEEELDRIGGTAIRHAHAKSVSEPQG